MINLEEEQKTFESILKKVKKVKKCVEYKYEEVPTKYKKDVDLLYNMSKLYGQKIDLLNKINGKPYFARIDFKSDNKDKKETCYISKVGLQDEDNNIITVDWRAPISALYYDSNVGEASYMAPMGKINGILDIKRQYNIEDSKLITVADVSDVSNDDLLLPYLADNADNRLKNIVSTIQVEQNSIIRRNFYDNVIIQGVAGSGKTTVALHRIAYLVYNNIDYIKPESYMIIGPNKFFVNYISNVLPDLDVNNVNQLTFLELILDTINYKGKVIDNNNINLSKLKHSFEYKEMLDNYINNYFKEILPNDNFYINNYLILTKSKVLEIFNKIDSKEPISEKIKRLYLDTKKYIKSYYHIIEDNLNIDFKNNIENLEREEIIKKAHELEIVKKELKKENNLYLKKYFSKFFPKINELYYDFLKNNIINNNKLLTDFNIELNETDIKEINKKNISNDDIIALTYMELILNGNNKYSNIKLVAIDEAQDYGIFDYLVMKLIFKNSVFNIYGDLAQSIKQYKAIDNWEIVVDKLFNKDCEIEYLIRSYRTTIEVMNEANKVTNLLKLKEAIPVIRHGEKVKYIKIKDKIEDIEYNLNKCKEKQYKTIAIICKDENEVLKVYNSISNKDDIHLITDLDNNYEGGICILTSTLAKGLEFDAVIISDASLYSENNTYEMKLLYVSMTRALHEMIILHNNSIFLK